MLIYEAFGRVPPISNLKRFDPSHCKNSCCIPSVFIEFHFCSFGSRLSGNIRDFGNSSATQLGQQGTQNYPNGDNHSLFQERLGWRAAKGRLYLTVLVGTCMAGARRPP